MAEPVVLFFFQNGDTGTSGFFELKNQILTTSLKAFWYFYLLYLI